MLTAPPNHQNITEHAKRTIQTTKKNMPLLTLNQAAKECGKSKSVLLGAIRAGRLSAIRDDLNQWQIDPAELFRVYQSRRSENGQKEQSVPHEERHQNALLLANIGHLEKQLATAESVADDLRADRDHWRQQATALLTHQPEPREAPTRKEGRAGLWLALLLALLASAGAGLFGYWWTMPQGGSL